MLNSKAALRNLLTRLLKFMGLYFVTVEKRENAFLTLRVEAMDTVNISRIPATKTFALGSLLDLWGRLIKGSVRLIKPQPERDAAKESAARAFYAKDWTKLEKLCFGYSLAVSQAEFEKAKNENIFQGKKLRGTSVQTKNGVNEYFLMMANDFREFREQAESFVKNVEFKHLPRSRSLKKGLLVVEFADAKMLDFLSTGLAWETDACQ